MIRPIVSTLSAGFAYKVLFKLFEHHRKFALKICIHKVTLSDKGDEQIKEIIKKENVSKVRTFRKVTNCAAKGV